MCKKIAFVPMVGLPSTEWVGDDIADYLATNHEVVKLKGFDDSFEADYVFIIKIIPSISWLLKQKEKEGCQSLLADSKLRPLLLS